MQANFFDRPSGNPNPYKKLKGRIQTHLQSIIELIATGAENNIKQAHNYENKPYATSSAGMAAAARRLKGE